MTEYFTEPERLRFLADEVAMGDWVKDAKNALRSTADTIERLREQLAEAERVITNLEDDPSRTTRT